MNPYPHSRWILRIKPNPDFCDSQSQPVFLGKDMKEVFLTSGATAYMYDILSEPILVAPY